MSDYPVNPWGKTYSPVPQGYKYDNNQWWDMRGSTPQVDPYMTADRPSGTLDPGNAQTRPWWWHAQMMPGVADAFTKQYGTSTQMPTGYRNPGGYWQGQTPDQMYQAWGRTDASMGPTQLQAVDQQRKGLIQQMMGYAAPTTQPQLNSAPNAPGTQPQLNAAPTAPNPQPQLNSAPTAPTNWNQGAGYGYQNAYSNPGYWNQYGNMFQNPQFLQALMYLISRGGM